MLSEKIKKSEGNTLFPCRATYITDWNGERKLARIEKSDRPIFRPKNWEREEKWEGQKVKIPTERNEEDKSPEERRRAIRRASERCMDIVLCNPFEWFCTLTIDPQKADRTSYNDIVRIFGRWASNNVQRNDMKYLAVPEHHKDGQAIHLHMLASGKLRMTESGIKQKGKSVYNLDTWQWGFTNCKNITGENAGTACAKYCLKYMRKQEGQKIGGRYYLSGGKLINPEYEYAETIEELNHDGESPKWTGNVEGEWGSYTKFSFI